MIISIRFRRNIFPRSDLLVFVFVFFFIEYLRRCKYKDICGNKVLRQRAYCFPRTSGSFCERWYTEQNIVPQLPPHYTKPTQRSLHQLSNEVPTLDQLTKQSPEYSAQHIKCGHPLGKRNATRNHVDWLKIMGGRTARRYKWPWHVAILNRYKVSIYYIIKFYCCNLKRKKTCMEFE